MVDLFNSKKNQNNNPQMSPEDVFKLHNEKRKSPEKKELIEEEEVEKNTDDDFEIVESSEYELGEKLEKKEEPKKEKTKKINIEQYKDLEGITIKKLTIGLWLVEHRRIIITIFYGFIAAIAILTWGYFLLSFGGYLIFGMRNDQNIISEIISGAAIDHSVVINQSPKNLRFGNVKTIKLDDNKYDFTVEVTNINEQHWGVFDYYFISNGNEIGHAEEFILPNESKYLYLLGEELGRQPSGVEVKIENLRWNRIDKSKYPDWDQFYEDHMRFEISDEEFIPESQSELSEKIGLNVLKFKIKNDTAYSYWEPVFSIRLMSRSTIIGVQKIVVNNLTSGETRDVEITWPGELSKVGEILVVPEINIIDKNVYIKPSAD